MRDNEELREWLDRHHITYDMRRDVVYIHDFGKAFIQDKYDHIFKKDKGGKVVFNCIENIELLKNDEIFYVIFKFGNRWFYVDIRDDLESIQFHLLRNIGKKPVFETDVDFYPLGMHTGYELLNGSGLVNDWCEKAAFLGYKGIGVCDRNTMAATLDVQRTCDKYGLKYVFGYSLTFVFIDGEQIDAKIYCQTDEGFRNLLRIQKCICVDNVEMKVIDYIDLLNHGRGNVLVFGKMMGKWLSDNCNKLDDIQKAFDGVFFQVDFSEYRADRIDSALLNSQKAYFDKFVYSSNFDYEQDPIYTNWHFLNNIRPVLIEDAYYVDEDDWKNKILLNKVDIGAAHEQSRRQFLKNIDELWDEFDALFSAKYDGSLFYYMCKMTVEIAEGASASYDLTDNYMPEYIMTPEEKKKYGTNHNMFLQLLEEGFKRLVPDGEEELYRERLDYEVYILEETDSVDYLLIQYDTINWARRNNILTGIGRGSAGGSLVLYLMGITLIDPIKYDLIFERFLIPERAGLEPCDVTILDSTIKSSDYVQLELTNSKIYLFDKDAVFRVRRNGQLTTVYADELQVDDDIIFDNRNLIYDFGNENK